jgi:hypothetical protein
MYALWIVNKKVDFCHVFLVQNPTSGNYQKYTYIIAHHSPLNLMFYFMLYWNKHSRQEIIFEFGDNEDFLPRNIKPTT